jgi:hypothetical protein
MSIRGRLILGVALLLFYPVYLYPTFIALLFFSFDHHSVSMLFQVVRLFSGLGSVAGMALLVLPYIRESECLEREYRYVDIGIVLALILYALSILPFYFLPETMQPYVGLPLLLHYARIWFFSLFLVLWAGGLAFAKNKLALMAVLCFVAINHIPFGTPNNPEISEQLNEPFQPEMWNHSEMDFEGASLDTDFLEAFEGNIEFQAPKAQQITQAGLEYAILLAAYTFMRVRRKSSAPMPTD